MFVDDEPLANWSHDCRYLLHDADSGKLYQEVKAGFPPHLVNPPDSFKAFHMPVVAQNPLRKIWTLDLDIAFPWKQRKGQRYAVLFSGASNNRHTNDLEFLYRQLVDRFYFDENKITVLNHDGTGIVYGTIVIAFVDLEPALNWTHRARYLVLNPEGGIRQTIDVDRPPFLTEVSPHLRVIHKGYNAPEWSVIVSDVLD